MSGDVFRGYKTVTMKMKTMLCDNENTKNCQVNRNKIQNLLTT